VPLATSLCGNLPAENTQPTRVAVPIEEEEEEDYVIFIAVCFIIFWRIISSIFSDLFLLTIISNLVR